MKPCPLCGRLPVKVRPAQAETTRGLTPTFTTIALFFHETDPKVCRRNLQRLIPLRA